jgi:hypothetical protein
MPKIFFKASFNSSVDFELIWFIVAILSVTSPASPFMDWSTPPPCTDDTALVPFSPLGSRRLFRPPPDALTRPSHSNNEMTTKKMNSGNIVIGSRI